MKYVLKVHNEAHRFQLYGPYDTQEDARQAAYNHAFFRDRDWFVQPVYSEIPLVDSSQS